MRISDQLNDGGPVFSFEFFPPKTPAGEEQLWRTVAELAQLDPTYVSVTYGAGGTTREGTLEISTRIKRDFGIEAMAHLSVVGETTAGLRALLEDYRDGGIENVLALRGDPPAGQPAFVPAEGGLGSAAELAALISSEFDLCVGSSCFPETHPEAASPAADIDYLKSKVEAGTEFLITQLFFDNSVFWRWQEQVRAAGIEVPIVVGLMPITSFAGIKRFCQICEADIPASLAGELEACGGDVEAEEALGIAYAARQGEELLAGGVAGVHLYTLNRSAAALALVRALRASRPWERAPSHAGRGAP